MAPDDAIAEIHGFSEPDATPMPWSAGLEQVIAADTFWLSTVRPDGRPHVTPVLEGEAEQVTVDAELDPIAAAFAAKYGTETWDYSVGEGAFIQRAAATRAIVFRVRPVRGLGFRKGDSFSQTTWRFSR